MEWKVVNAISRDVERQHLNKILADIKASVGASPTQQTVTNIVNNVISQQPAPPQFPVTSIRVQLQGDVAGQGQATAGGLVVVPTSIDPALLGVPEAPTDGLPYWRMSGTWQEVPAVLTGAENFQYPGVPYIDENYMWQQATTDELPEGIANLYFPEAPVDGVAYARKDGAWAAVEATSVFNYISTDGEPYCTEDYSDLYTGV